MRWLGIVFAWLALLVTVVTAEAITPLKPSQTDKCPVCGMFVAKYPDWFAQITFKDGSHAFFDGVKDMMKYYFNIPKFKPEKKPSDIAALLVTEYYSLKVIDGLKAYYVVGSDVYGPMGRELIPFAQESAAKEFMRDHGGRLLGKFSEITPQLIKSLD